MPCGGAGDSRRERKRTHSEAAGTAFWPPPLFFPGIPSRRLFPFRRGRCPHRPARFPLCSFGAFHPVGRGLAPAALPFPPPWGPTTSVGRVYFCFPFVGADVLIGPLLASPLAGPMPPVRGKWPQAKGGREGAPKGRRGPCRSGSHRFQAGPLRFRCWRGRILQRLT